MINVLIYNEFVHERESGSKAASVYPDGIHGAIAGFLNKQEDIHAETVTLDNIDTAITSETLKNTDVMFWWGHMAHDDVPDEKARLVAEAVHNGMGIVFLHSGHKSKPFLRLMGTTGALSWRESDDRERIWVATPAHPVAAGLDRYFELPAEETYSEPFDIPAPDETVFIGWFSGGEVFRSGCSWRRGNGKIFYFQPGHESYPTYFDPNVRKILLNAVHWAKPNCRVDNKDDCPWIPVTESLGK